MKGGAQNRELVCGIEPPAERVAVGPDLSTAESMSPFHLILESVGASLGAALGMLAPGGT